jgi:hypothetical protein
MNLWVQETKERRLKAWLLAVKKVKALKKQWVTALMLL